MNNSIKKELDALFVEWESRMKEKDSTSHFHNYCFEIELTDNVKYSYKITSGVARNQNATYLLRGILMS